MQSINKDIRSKLDTRDPRSSQDPIDVWWSSTHRTIHVGIWPRPLKDSGNVQKQFTSSHSYWNMRIRLASYFFVPDYCNIQEMCITAVETYPWHLAHVPNHFKTQEICNDAGCEDWYSLEFVPDCYVKLQEMWYEDFDNDDELIEWCNGYK